MIVFDIETDGLVHDVTTIHCMVLYNSEDGTTTRYSDNGHADPIVRGVNYLEQADRLVGHNIINYDLRVIQKLYPYFSPRGDVIDTLVLSRLYHPNLMEIDKKTRGNTCHWVSMVVIPLKPYGYRLGEFKGSFSKDTDWKEWSKEMEDYCAQDVVVTTKLRDHFHPYLNGSR